MQCSKKKRDSRSAGPRFKQICPETLEPYNNTETVPGRVVFLGTLHPKVNPDVIRNVAELPEVSECIVIGDGPRRSELDELAEAVDSLRVTGRLPDDEAFPLLASAAVAINPQYGSDLQVASSPVKLYYYAALGRPMVLTEGPELVETLADAGAAVAIEPDGAFVDAVQELLSDDDRLSAMGDTARNAGRESTWNRRTDQLVDVYS